MIILGWNQVMALDEEWAVRVDADPPKAAASVYVLLRDWPEESVAETKGCGVKTSMGMCKEGGDLRSSGSNSG